MGLAGTSPPRIVEASSASRGRNGTSPREQYRGIPYPVGVGGEFMRERGFGHPLRALMFLGELPHLGRANSANSLEQRLGGGLLVFTLLNPGIEVLQTGPERLSG